MQSVHQCACARVYIKFCHRLATISFWKGGGEVIDKCITWCVRRYMYKSCTSLLQILWGGEPPHCLYQDHLRTYIAIPTLSQATRVPYRLVYTCTVYVYTLCLQLWCLYLVMVMCVLACTHVHVLYVCMNQCLCSEGLLCMGVCACVCVCVCVCTSWFTVALLDALMHITTHSVQLFLHFVQSYPVWVCTYTTTSHTCTYGYKHAYPSVAHVYTYPLHIHVRYMY